MISVFIVMSVGICIYRNQFVEVPKAANSKYTAAAWRIVCLFAASDMAMSDLMKADSICNPDSRECLLRTIFVKG